MKFWGLCFAASIIFPFVFVTSVTQGAEVTCESGKADIADAANLGLWAGGLIGAGFFAGSLVTAKVGLDEEKENAES